MLEKEGEKKSLKLKKSEEIQGKHYVYMTAEIDLASLHPPRPYATRSHMHTGPLVIAIATPSL
jgi:hypothetical protein